MSGAPLTIMHIGNGRAFKIKAIVDAFVERGHRLHMVPIPPIEGDWPGVTWHNLPTPGVPGPLRVAARLAQVRSLARRLRPDVVHAHNAWGPGWYGAACGVHPFVIHAYGGDLLPEQYAGRPALQRRLTRWACRTADRVVVTGRHMIDASSGLGIPRDRLMLLPRGVDLRSFKPGVDTSALRASLGIGDATPVMFSPRYQIDEALYNVDVVLDAFASFKRHFPKAVCIQMYAPKCVEAKRDLEARAAQLGLADAYRLVPAADNATMPLFYNLADVVASVPSSDGFPVTVLEASACGTPLVVSRLPYCDEWFDERRNGLIVPVRDADALATAMIEVCTDRELHDRIARAGRQLVEERADYHRCMDALERDYRSLIAVRRGETPPGN